MIASEVARALAHAHQFGVIHRDVKPENVMIRDDGLVKLTDFGIAQIVDKERMTVTGQLLGSPAYMAPEHVEGRPLDFRTDVFAVGIVLYQLATGQLPFRGQEPARGAQAHRRVHASSRPDAVNALVGKRLNRVIDKALQREPDARYPDVGAAAARAHRRSRRRRHRRRARRARALLRRSEGLGARVQAAAGRGADGERARARGRRAHGGGARAVGARARRTIHATAELRALVDGVAAHDRRARMMRRAAIGGGARSSSSRRRGSARSAG